MSDWYWRVIALKAAFVLTCVVSYMRCDDGVQKLPFCNPHLTEAAPTNDLLIVSTLDGRLTAFSTEDGAKAWDFETSPLLSSNLHHVELSSGGKWVRLVPSLRGTLYSVTGDSIEPLPFDAEQLLSSSYKYSEDLVIAGAHESLWTGLDARTGGVVYSCGARGCSGEQRAAADVLVLRRRANTVRALDPRTGAQKWNFSVAEHKLALSVNRECLSARPEPPAALALSLALPDGLLVVRHAHTHHTLWQHKLESPVAGMWRLHGNTLVTIDVLEAATSLLPDASVQHTPPSLYIGVHNQQLYVQESVLYDKRAETAVSISPIPWKLQHSRPLIGESTAMAVQDAPSNTLSLIALYGNTGVTGNHGFFLYLQETCDESVQVPESIDNDPERNLPNDSTNNHQHVHVHVSSLWFWWKEVLLIAISSALLMNLMIWPRFFAPKLRVTTPLPVKQEYIIVKEYERPPNNNNVEYSGRYETDFTPLRCLGRGGFGVVFEARNNIDHCSYAVKRITLPRRASHRERVLREVRALAKLEHEHIVRYFNAWLEEPPLHYQEQRDKIWMRDLPGVELSEFTSSVLPEKGDDGSVRVDMRKDSELSLQFGKQLLPKRNRSLSCNDSFVIEFDENATKPHLSHAHPSSSQVTSQSGDVTPPNCLSQSIDPDDDSFIVFADSKDSGLSEARNNSVDKRLERVKQCESYVKTEVSSGKKKKGHTRHWSLDMCVKTQPEPASAEPEPASAEPEEAGASKMYLYIQMQLCRPDSLHDWLRQNRTLQDRGDKVTTLFSQIVSAVEYVHMAGLIHRDLKPSNIFFAPDGKVKVGDFGLVTTMGEGGDDEHAAGGDTGGKHTHRVGTHLYMSPEQLAGLRYSYKVDIYSLGVILFELLQPFGTEAERAAALLALREGRLPPDFTHNYPEESGVVLLMVSESPARRPAAPGVRARAPLRHRTDPRWHFALPHRQHADHT